MAEIDFAFERYKEMDNALAEFYIVTKDSDKKYLAKGYKRELYDSNNDAMKYLRHEIITLKSLDHPNIIKIEELKKTKENYFFFMEYVNGNTLSNILKSYISKNETPFSEEIAQHLMIQIMDALKYIHSKNIVHRDLNLENIFLDFNTEEDKENLNILNSTVKICDFYTSSHINKPNLLHAVIGSPLRMDPIILKGLVTQEKSGYDERIDIYSVGICLYEMLTGKTPFEDDDLDAFYEKVGKGIFNISSDFSKETISLLKEMLKYDFNKRLSSKQLMKHPFFTKGVNTFEKNDNSQDSIEVNIKDDTQTFNPEGDDSENGNEPDISDFTLEELFKEEM